MPPLAIGAAAHLLAPERCRLGLERRVGPNLSLGLGKPHHLAPVGLARDDDEIRVVLPRSIALVVGHREAEALVLEVPDDVRGGIEELRELLLEIGVARHLVRVAALALGQDARPLETAQVRRIEPLRRPEDRHGLDASGAGATYA